MMRSIANIGDRLLALLVPEHRAAADDCITEYRCGPYACTKYMDYKVRKQVRRNCWKAGAGPWRNTNYCCYI
ncbi:hypothetical protein GCM10018965_081890 [Nonomuraea roseola]